MKRNSLAHVLLLLAVAAAGLGQSEDEPYFSLRSSHTFGSNGAPNVACSARRTSTRSISASTASTTRCSSSSNWKTRTSSEDASPRPPHEPSFLETIHNWKASLRATVRRSVRAQFTESPAVHFQNLLHRTKNGRQPGPLPRIARAESAATGALVHARGAKPTSAGAMKPSISISNSAAFTSSKRSTRTCGRTPSSWSPIWSHHQDRRQGHRGLRRRPQHRRAGARRADLLPDPR
jgi:hypothetical protein